MAKKIMIVDDERDIIASVTNLLESYGYKVVSANGGQECLEIIKGEKPDLLLLDFFMPGLSGRDVIAALRKEEETKDLKVIFMTVAEFREKGMKKLQEYNISGYVTKPIDIKELVTSVKKAVGE